MDSKGRIITEITFEDNDASASAFGWQFQLLSAIPLILRDIKNVKHFIIEGKYQDIEIYYSDDTQSFIQAKAVQMEDSENNSTKNNKFKQAIISLYKTPFVDSKKIIYCSNFKSPILDDAALFSNKLVNYNNCPASIKNQIDSLIMDAATLVENDLKAKKKNAERNGKIIDKRVEESMNMLSERLRNDSLKTNIYFYTVYPFFGEGRLEERASVIDDKIVSFLSDEVQLKPKTAVAISTRLLKHWAVCFLNDAGTISTSDSKTITKQELLWPIVVFNSSFDTELVKETMKGRITSSDISEAEAHLNDEVFLQLQRFQFLHKLYKDFASYLKSITSINPELDFIKEKWDLYKEEFDIYTSDSVQLEYITKCYLYRLLLDYRSSNNLNNGANVW